PFKELLQNTCGLLFENEREATLVEGLCRRISLRSAGSPGEYHHLLLQEPEEMHHLVELLTINETYFFREPEQLKLMQQQLIPELLAAHPGRPLKILSAGCSTGEEPYSIAMLLREAYGPESAQRFCIVGVDIDAAALAAARRGVYGKGSFRGMDQALVERYCKPHGSGEQRLTESIRSQVQLGQVNLLARDYPPLMNNPDIIFYRNVSIYFGGQTQRDIFSRLAETLNESGYLFVSATETMHHNIGVLPLLQRGTQFLYRKVQAPSIADRRQTRRSAPVAAPGSGQKAARTAAAPPRKAPAKPVRGRPAAPATQERSAEQLFDEALELVQKGRPEEALALLDELFARDAACAKSCALKAAILLELSRFQESRAVCEAALARNPLCLDAALMLGLIARHEGDSDEAFKRFREALYLDTACWPAHFFIAEGMAVLGEKKRARNGFETVLRILEKGAVQDHDREFFPLAFKAEHYLAMCRHKLTLL
ncbi:MAG: hypothetical protein A2051_06355, partial [Desulfovibrionales bacterium GWA2_65_9]